MLTWKGFLNHLEAEETGHFELYLEKGSKNKEIFKKRRRLRSFFRILGLQYSKNRVSVLLSTAHANVFPIFLSIKGGYGNRGCSIEWF